MALELVTGYWGQEHVTADQDSDMNAGIVGSGMYVLPIGEKMRAEAVTSNKIRIFDGLFLGYGRQCAIEEGAYDDVEIENGTAGLLRNDFIVVKYAKDEVTGVEGVSFGVLKGQTGTTATDPVPNNQDIRTGAFESEMPLYRVKLNGLAIESIQALYTVPNTMAAMTTALDTLNSNIQNLKDSISGIYTANLSVPNITIDGTVYTGTTEIVYLRIKNTADTRAILIGIAVGASDGAVWSKYVTTNKILIRKVNDGTWTNWTSI